MTMSLEEVTTLLAWMVNLILLNGKVKTLYLINEFVGFFQKIVGNW